ncbi:MAG: DUF3488 and transglutaminase-like domain-containing protein [Pseudomonadota bacterium]
MTTQANQPLGVAQQIPRNSLALLMLAQIVVVLPLVGDISPWIVPVCVFCGYWRWLVYQGRQGHPSGFVKVVLVIASVAGIAFSGYSSFSLEAATSLLVVAFALKLVEMKNRRDAYVVIYLSYFLIATAFLYAQGIALTAYELFAAVVVTAAMVGMNQLHTRVRPFASLKTAFGLIVQAIPLTVVIFLLFPRISPLWSIPVPSAASTGLSDKLTPGDVASLSRSDDLAFRVVFEDSVPAQRELYWRGLVYSEFKYGTWSIAQPLDEIEAVSTTQAGLGYDVFLEPTQSTWLFALDTPSQLPNRGKLLGDFRLVNPEPILSVLRYSVRSNPDALLDLVLSDGLRARETAIPEEDNPRLQEYARDLYDKVGGDTRDMVNAMMAHIRTQPFVYTLRPPTLSFRDSIDEFWFDTRRGFCTHYAGATVFALRTVGIPARMVGGYQGGEVNPVTGHMVVRQYDAHAWIEVWIEEQGWVRFDPTAAVAPARVEDGLNAALSTTERGELSFLSSARQGDGSFVRDALRFVDSLEYRWNLWVVGYDNATQTDVLRDFFGEITPMRIAGALLAGSVASMALVVLALFWRRKRSPRHPVESMVYRFCTSVRDPHLRRSEHESPGAYLVRLGDTLGQDTSGFAYDIQALLYDPDLLLPATRRWQLRWEFLLLRMKLSLTRKGKAGANQAHQTN